MAKPDHTALARLSGLPDFEPDPSLGRLLHLMGSAEESQQRRSYTLAGVAFANHVIACVLDRSDAIRDAKANGKLSEPGLWPLDSAHIEGLLTAIYFLNQYTESLVLEQGG